MSYLIHAAQSSAAADPDTSSTSPPIVDSWCTALTTLIFYLNNVIASPGTPQVRRINSRNPSLRRRMETLSVPSIPLMYRPQSRSTTPSKPRHGASLSSLSTASSLHRRDGVSSAGVYLWPGLHMLTAVGWVLESDGWLTLPRGIPMAHLASRLQELRMAQSLLVNAQSSALALQSIALQASSPGRGGLVLAAVPSHRATSQHATIVGSGAVGSTSGSGVPTRSSSVERMHSAAGTAPTPTASAAVTSTRRGHVNDSDSGRPRPRSAGALTRTSAATATASRLNGSSDSAAAPIVVPSSLDIARREGSHTRPSASNPVVPSLPLSHHSLATPIDVSAPLREAASATATAAMTAVGPHAALQLLQSASAQVTSQQGKILELEAKVCVRHVRCPLSSSSVVL